MKLKNKILIITLIFVAIIFLIKLDCFATEIDLNEIVNSDIEISDDYKQNILKYKYIFAYNTHAGSSKGWAIIGCDAPFYITDDQTFLTFAVKVPATYSFLRCYGSSDSLYLEQRDTSITSAFIDNTFSSLSVSTFDSILYNNFNVYEIHFYRDENYNHHLTETSNLVFQAPPQGLTQVLEEGYQTAQKITTQSITQQLGVLVPVGIVIMATLILVSLIAYFHFWRQ